jgi:LmbE family N-acetylglucosaminyl deacetylase
MKILVISPHPDDEAIGCGGTIIKHVAEGDMVEVVFITSGENGGHGKSPEETIKLREQESIEAANILQVSNISFWKEPDGNFQVNEANINRLIEKIKIMQPAMIYVTHEQEEHPDHRSSAKLVIEAVNRLSDKIKPAILMYEVWTPIQKIDHIVDISSYVDLKRKAILAHKSQCEVMKFEEAILALNRYRGEMHCWPGGDYAEIFKEMKL